MNDFIFINYSKYIRTKDSQANSNQNQLHCLSRQKEAITNKCEDQKVILKQMFQDFMELVAVTNNQCHQRQWPSCDKLLFSRAIHFYTGH